VCAPTVRPRVKRTAAVAVLKPGCAVNVHIPETQVPLVHVAAHAPHGSPASMSFGTQLTQRAHGSATPASTAAPHATIGASTCVGGLGAGGGGHPSMTQSAQMCASCGSRLGSAEQPATLVVDASAAIIAIIMRIAASSRCGRSGTTTVLRNVRVRSADAAEIAVLPRGCARECADPLRAARSIRIRSHPIPLNTDREVRARTRGGGSTVPAPDIDRPSALSDGRRDARWR
jgi:hypothetical protein